MGSCQLTTGLVVFADWVLVKALFIAPTVIIGVM